MRALFSTVTISALVLAFGSANADLFVVVDDPYGDGPEFLS
jgi:hypothetical protein